jgi:hypothetical protein
VYFSRNSDPYARPSAVVLGLLLAVVSAVALLGSSGAAAQGLRDQAFRRPLEPIAAETQDPEDPGHFEVLAARTQLLAGVYFLDASIAYRLSADARKALRSGVPLTVRLDVEFLHSRRFWFDSEDAALRQRYRLEYHSLGERFLVTNLNSGDQASFGTLLLALNHLGRVERLPLIDAALLEQDRDYDLRLRAVLDVEQFPGPLRLLAFWRRDWSLASDWYRWPLQND